MSSVNRIITAKDYSLRYGGDGTARGFILRWREKLKNERGAVLQINGLDDPQGEPVLAYIHQGQWIAECDLCGGHEFIDPQEPIFFCFGCANRSTGGYVRPVTVPENWQAIEQAILARPVHDWKGLTDLERAGLARAAVVVEKNGVEYPLVRSWKPDETLEELLAQNAVLDGLTVDDREVTKVILNDEVNDGV
jgi:hypothetical protein